MNWRPVHPQVVASNGVEVDAGIVDLLEVLWGNGFKTEFSCQGVDGFEAYIGFTSGADARRFVSGVDVYALYGPGECFVQFGSHQIEAVTEFWSSRVGVAS